MPHYIWLAAFLSAIGGSLSVGAEASSPELGRSIFEKGVGRDGREIGGRIHDHLDLRGAAVACASCHGPDARGGGEGFVQAPDIRWHTLSKSFAPRRAGSTRPAYNRSTFGRAIHQGVDSNDRLLDPAMPRFDLSQDETEALVSYLARSGEGSLGEDVPTKVVLGLLPSFHPTKFSRELGNRLTLCPSIGANTRFPPLEIVHYASPADALSKTNALITEGRVSSILAPYIAGWESQYINAAKEWPVATLLPVTSLDLPEHPTLAFTMPGLTSQVGALLDRAFTGRTEALTVLTAPSMLPSYDIVDFIRGELRTHHVPFDEADLERSDSIRPSTRWLVLAPLAQVEKRLHHHRHLPGRTAFVPAMFFDPEAAQRMSRRMSGMIWHIAYPYQPTDTRTGRWRNPAEAWSEAGCALMAIIAEEGQEGISRRSSIMLESGMTIFHTRGQVVVQKWQPRKASRQATER